jgi:hypothetical protein
MNASEVASGDYDVGSGAFAPPPSPTPSDPTPQWVLAIVVILAILPIVSWSRRRCVVSFLIALSAFASVGALVSYNRQFLGMDRLYWSWADFSVGVALDLVAAFYLFSANHPCTYLLALLTVGLVLADGFTPDRYALNVAWHVTAYALLTVIPGQLPTSVDDPQYYYERRKRGRHVPVPQVEDWDPSYPGLYIPPGERNFFQ